MDLEELNMSTKKEKDKSNPILSQRHFNKEINYKKLRNSHDVCSEDHEAML